MTDNANVPDVPEVPHVPSKTPPAPVAPAPTREPQPGDHQMPDASGAMRQYDAGGNRI
jgi:hypothetical protein